MCSNDFTVSSKMILLNLRGLYHHRLFKHKRVSCILILLVIFTSFLLATINRGTSRLECSNRNNTEREMSIPIRNVWNERDKCWLSLSAEKGVQCIQLFMNNVDYLNQVAQTDRSATSSSKTCQLELLSEDCDNLIHFHGYISKPVTQEELNFPLAFSIKMHKAAKQAEQLLRTIWRPQNVYCIHVDLKADPSVYQTMITVAACFENVYVLENRKSVLYTSIDMLKTDLMCMEELSKRNSQWKYYINLSGQELVLKTNWEMVKILKILNGSNDIESFKYPLTKVLLRRFKYVHKRGNEIMEQTTNIKDYIPSRFNSSHNTLRKGSMYGCFVREFVQFVLHSPIATELIRWAEDIYAPEELVWASLSSLSEAPGNFLHRSFRVIRQKNLNFLSRSITWIWSKHHRCSGFKDYIRSVCHYSVYELSWLREQPTLAANKFDEQKDQVVLDCLEELLYNRTFKPDWYHFHWYFYYHLPQTVDRH